MLNAMLDWTPNDVAARFDVSRESLERMRAFVELLLQWQRRINLVAPSTANQIWRRHVGDSLQLLRLLPKPCDSILDLGSGAGFPGLALAIAGGFKAHLVESNIKKAAFLREASRRTDTDTVVLDCRIELLGREKARIRVGAVTARALAQLPLLLDYAAPWLASGTPAFFLKGQTVDDELTESAKSWRIDYVKHPSVTDSRAAILEITGIRRA